MSDVEGPRLFKIKVSDIRKCPHLIILPSHYRDDGTCRCDDPEHSEMAQWGYIWVSGRWR